MAPAGVRYGDHDRSLAHVEPRDGIQRIEVQAHDLLKSPGGFARMGVKEGPNPGRVRTGAFTVIFRVVSINRIGKPKTCASSAMSMSSCPASAIRISSW